MNRTWLVLGVLLWSSACGSPAVAPLDSAPDRASERPDLAIEEPAAADHPDAGLGCLEFPGCSKLIFDGRGCPIGCDVQYPPDAGTGDQRTDTPPDDAFDTNTTDHQIEAPRDRASDVNDALEQS